MLQIIQNLLQETNTAHEWLICDQTIESSELFFVRKNLDMNRRKTVRHIHLTVYHNFELDGKKYKGSASTRLSPSMTEAELKAKIKQAALAASLVKNKYYTLAEPTDEILSNIQSTFETGDLSSFMPRLVNTVFSQDHHTNGCINSSEFFLEKVGTRIINSCGVDERFTSYKGMIELIAEWQESGESVELFEMIEFSDLDEEALRQRVSDVLNHARLRAIAQPTPKLTNVPVILPHENAIELLRYYKEQADAMLIYQKYSTAKVGKNIQGDAVSGDKLTMSLLPELKSSVASRYIDASGYKLHTLPLYKNGVLQCYHGSSRYLQYLGLAPTGLIGNVQIGGGALSLNELKKQPYLEVRYFSDFQIDEWTGDFGGEIRLAIYFDGEKEIPVTGGSISGKIQDAQSTMRLSKETHILGSYDGPVAVKLEGVTIAV